MRELIKALQKNGIKVIFSNLSARIIQKLERAGLKPDPERLVYCRSISEARAEALLARNS
jgi:hypothetical protein